MKRDSPAAVACAAISRVLIGCVLASPATHAGDLCGHGPLEILLTNDDGYRAPGIRALYDALRAAGHFVTMVAPESDMSGSSSSLTRSEITVRKEPGDGRIRAVTATPATAVLLAVNAPLVSPRPDLVVSGINDGANTGAALPFSGTVGAVIAAAMLLDPPVPGIAVSAAQPAPSPAAAGANPEARASMIARRFVQLLDSLRPALCAKDVVANGVRALNVNFPPTDVTAINGVRATVADARTNFAIAFRSTGEGSYQMAASDAGYEAGDSDTDVAWLARGFITVTPMSDANSPKVALEPSTRALIDSGAAR